MFTFLETTPEFVVAITWMVLTLTVGNSGYEMKYKCQSPYVYFWDLGHATL